MENQNDYRLSKIKSTFDFQNDYRLSNAYMPVSWKFLKFFGCLPWGWVVSHIYQTIVRLIVEDVVSVHEQRNKVSLCYKNIYCEIVEYTKVVYVKQILVESCFYQSKYIVRRSGSFSYHYIYFWTLKKIFVKKRK